MNVFYQIKCCLYTQDGGMNKKYITKINCATNARSIQQTPIFHGCTLTNLNITIKKYKCVKLCALKTIEVTGPHQVFVDMLLTFKLL